MKKSWVRVPVKTVSVARKLSTIEERCKEQNCLLQELRSQIQKLSWVRVSVKMLLRDKNIFFCDILRYVSNGQVYDNLSGNKDW
jgi:hypothetical protein